MDDALQIVECCECWARAGSVEAIEHQPGVIHPAEVEYKRYEFEYRREPAAGLFGQQA